MCNSNCDNRHYVFNRRDMLRSMASGFGYLAFASLAEAAAAGDRRRLRRNMPDVPGPLDPRAPHFEPRAKRVIFLCMGGGPSHVDTFDYKPELLAADGTTYNRGGRRTAKLLGSPFKFKQHGEGGLWISELFPNVAAHADKLCLMRSMHTDVPAHAAAVIAMHTGSFQFVRPSMGSWTLYGLGTENENLPGFITINPPTGQGGAQNYGSAFLPAIYQGLKVNARGGSRRGASDAVPNIANKKLTVASQREQIDLIQALNEERLRRDRVHPGVEGVIESYELAFRMQAEMPGVMNINEEPKSVSDLYGLEDEATADFGRQCLLARRYAEAGVRFVEVNKGGWDQHRNLRAAMTDNCQAIDKPIAGLLSDLAQRGMLKDTLVIWGGEFGRTPYAQNKDGRDHNNKGFTMWMAGGGVKGGLSYGSTDETGREAVDNKVHVHDWHATILHLMGLNHEKLTYRYAGRDFRLTEVYGNVVKDIMV